jgi:hypothetical protein
MVTTNKIIIILVHAFVGWALCAVTIGIAIIATTLDNALVIHAVGAPLFFIFVSLVYVNKFNYTSPFHTAVIFLAFVIAVDLFIVALLINKSLEMFTSLLGTWIPFALIFVSTYLTMHYSSKKKRREKRRESDPTSRSS